MSSNQAFKRSFLLLVLTGASLCIVFLALNLLQPPRLRHSQIDTRLVVTQPGERLALTLNQPISAVRAAQVSITPTADFTVTSSGEAVIIQFTGRLRYDTSYAVKIRGAQSAYQHSKKTDVTTTFTTANPAYYYVHRDYGPGPDQIIKATLGGTSQTIFSSPRIQDYVITDTHLVVATIDTASSTNQLTIVDLSRPDQQQRIRPPMAGTISHLQSAPGSGLIGFTFTSKQASASGSYENTLYNVDLSKGTDVYPATGLDHKKLQTQDWRFAPDGTTILAQLDDTSLLLVDTTNKYPPAPLGQYALIKNFSYNGARLIADKGSGPGVLDVLRNTFSVLPDKTVDGTAAYAASALALNNSQGYVLQQQAFSKEDYTYYLVLHRKATTKTLYQAPGRQTALGQYRLSPNDQVLAAELSPAGDTEFDNYLDNGRSTHVHTRLVDTYTGETLDDIDGFDVQWQ